ncbi:micrococcal nuclease [Nocardioides zeae]|uniref:Micrococcal nuclease n=2 Tax=Nocardioides zeae TaxID=1457234 RepID=A0AAJ1U2H1_9ACTN|nr:thermonuclease family protein [Nocardioides zeae]MDQ1106370.1 micrococcal nuclease [Nocardioides zeae]MDR6173943.1 micrococcal nuclease [Nocardioides zeae]MDR6211501.1 micrococcal nuclease [Nocardioides zeae]
MRTRVVGILLTLLVVGAIWFTGNRAEDDPRGGPDSEPGGEPGDGASSTAVVTAVVDGDTIRVVPAGSDEERRVRLLGLDAPEVRGTPECGGAEATDVLVDLLPVGTTVTLVGDPTQDDVDRYDRLLRYVEGPDGTDVGERLVASGWVATYVFRDEFERLDRYAAAEDRAEAEGRGAWSGC